MASADYSPYPLHTASASAPVRQQNNTASSSTSRPGPKHAKRVDSGLDNVSETSSITFTDDVERRLALRQHLRRIYREPDSESGDDEESEEDEGELGLRTVDSIGITAGRARTWESKEVRARKNRRSRSSRVTKLSKWIKKLLGQG